MLISVCKSIKKKLFIRTQKQTYLKVASSLRRMNEPEKSLHNDAMQSKYQVNDAQFWHYQNLNANKQVKIYTFDAEIPNSTPKSS